MDSCLPFKKVNCEGRRVTTPTWCCYKGGLGEGSFFVCFGVFFLNRGYVCQGETSQTRRETEKISDSFSRSRRETDQEKGRKKMK